MTQETKMEIKRDYYAKAREKAAMCLTAMGAKPKDGVEPNSWEGMMSMAEYVLDHKPTAAEEAAVLMAVSRWNAAEVECGKYDAMKAAREMIDREVAAATKSAPLAYSVSPTFAFSEPGAVTVKVL